MPKRHKIPVVLIETIALSLQLGFIIAFPLTVLAILGRLLDRRLSTSPCFLLLGIGLSICISGIGLYQKIKKIIDSSTKEK